MCVIWRDFVILCKSLSLVSRKLRKCFSYPLNPFIINLKRNKIRTGEIAVVVGFFLASHGRGCFSFWVPQPCFLNNYSSVFKNLSLTDYFILKRLLQVSERIHILKL